MMDRILFRVDFLEDEEIEFYSRVDFLEDEGLKVYFLGNEGIEFYFSESISLKG